MKAILVKDGGELAYEDFPDPVAGPGEVVVELKTAAVNRRDLLVRNPPGPVYEFPKPLVPGSDGAGIRRDTGEEVVIYPGLHWDPGEDCAGSNWGILGGPSNGTYAELVKVPEANVYRKPARFSWDEAAAFPLAALTAHRALFAVGRLQSHETVLVLGAGSGVSTFAVQLAAQEGARVLVTSSKQEKIERAKELGAAGGALYTEDGWAEAVGPVDLVLDSVGSTWQDSLNALRPGGRLVVFGATGGAEVTINVRATYLNWKSIRGTTMGSPLDFFSMLRMVNDGDWHPVIDSVRPLAEAEAAHDRMKAGEHFGKLVLEIA
jgi:NADPH:quinone reductase-like Zn-dependent oxidoreductase